MKFIINNKLYDTSKAKLLCKGNKSWPIDTLLGKLYRDCETELYKTKKGAYFFVCKYSYTSYIKVVSEEVAKDWFMRTDYDEYAKMFGELEEA